MSFDKRKVRFGRVVGDKMDKTVVVSVQWRTSHPLYRKAINRRARFKAHDAANECRVGDLVRLVETRPYSKTKRWRVAGIISREEIAEVQPDEIAVDEEVMITRGASEDSPVAEPEDTEPEAVEEAEEKAADIP
jgi:small subunit ribosomal protein S17